jgi:hypothetical protein
VLNRAGHRDVSRAGNTRTRVGRWALCILFSACLGVASASAGPMETVTGTWNLIITSADVISGTAGRDVSSSYSSLVSGTGGPIIVDVSAGGPGGRRITIQRTSTLPPGVALIASISTVNSGVVSLNNSPCTVPTGSTATFYETSTKDSNVTIYYQYTGVSIVNLTATTYTTTVTFTAIEI